MPISPEAARHRGAIAGIKRAIRNGERPADDPQLKQEQEALHAVLLRERAERIVADWGPLTDEQREHIAALLRTGSVA